MSVRDRRLRADHRAVVEGFKEHPYIRIKDVEGDPPDRYRIDYQVPSLVVKSGDVVRKRGHRVEVYLTLGYPRQSPQCRMLTPVFHPNIAPHAVCVGDHWSAGESLAALIVRIGEMLTFQSYNTKSPLNGDAARWADTHVERLPLLEEDLAAGLADVKPLAARAVESGETRPLPAQAGPPPGGTPIRVRERRTGRAAAAATAEASPARGRLVRPTGRRRAAAAPAATGRPATGRPATPRDRSMALVKRGIARAKQKDLEGAMADLDHACRADPENVHAFRNRAILRSKLGQQAAAADDYEAVLRLDPENERADWMHRYVKAARARRPG